MTKREFLSALEARLYGLPTKEKREFLEYYSEMIDDRIDDDIDEEEAVKALGTMDEIVNEILSDVSLSRIVKEKVQPKRKANVWEIVLLILGSPVWLSIALALVAVVCSVYIVLWAVVITFYSVTLALGMCGIVGMIGMIWFAAGGKIASGFFLLGAGFICAGLSILFFHLSNLITKGIIVLGKVMIISMKRLFIGKEAA